ncbi:hypothetical protein OB955_12815 [Halobacteria archaeon AArc-m2/3/4]|uniref:Uncharacterized protein n=1 Tax=Natronoglomus mannanivorans TaxID=2979990 RepID=A0AAP2YXA2_9EURY|nr:hypothetical protein [Halobacteria archaeon AArc-xg1-1]MCU4973616.1 hypothetical protein [Halobacteria archaeon AArc-m2/3/4]
MSNTNPDDTTDALESDFLEPCPSCGRPTVGVCVKGPMERYSVPCGCQTRR